MKIVSQHNEQKSSLPVKNDRYIVNKDYWVFELFIRRNVILHLYLNQYINN